MKLRLYLLSCMLPLLASCGTVTTPTTGSGTTGTSATADLQTTITHFLALSADQQVSLAKAMGSLDLLDWAQQNQSASSDSRKTSFTALLSAHPSLAAQIASVSNGAQGGMGGPGGQPPGGGPGGLPPNIEEIRAQYPELATALENIQSLSPDERRTQMDALIQAHPEWQAVLMPAGGPGGSPPPGGFGGPGGSPPPGFPSGGPAGPPPSALPSSQPSAAAN